MYLKWTSKVCIYKIVIVETLAFQENAVRPREIIGD